MSAYSRNKGRRGQLELGNLLRSEAVKTSVIGFGA